MIENKRAEDVIAYEDKDFLILHAKDRFNGIRVQLYAKIPTRRQEADGTVKELGIKPHHLEEIEVSFYKLGKTSSYSKSEEERKALQDPATFRQAVLAAEQVLKTRLETHYRKMDEMADGLLNDLRGKYKELNGERK